jgi:hypothetical protein
MLFPCCITNAENTHTEYVMRIARSLSRFYITLYVYIHSVLLFPNFPDRLWSPPSPWAMATAGSVTVVFKGQVVQLAADLRLVPKNKADFLSCHSLHSA